MQIMMHIFIILDLDTCAYDVHMCVWCVWCAYGVYGTHIYDPGLWSWYMHVWCTYLRSLILIHVCIMQVCMMNFDPQSLALMHVWCIMYISMILMQACIYDAANFVPDGRANEQGDSRSWIEKTPKKVSSSANKSTILPTGPQTRWKRLWMLPIHIQAPVQSCWLHAVAWEDLWKSS